MKSRQTHNWVVKPLVPEEVYTDRTEFLDYFYHAALEAAHRRTMSTVLLGKRRMGKTEIFKRVVNRLFFEQDPKDPNAIVPVYYCFQDGPLDRTEFAKVYLENFMRYYVGFYTAQPELINDEADGEELVARIEQARSMFPFTSRTFDLLLRKYRSIVTGDSTLPHKTALETPRRISDIDDSTIVMFLDEFQNTRLPHYNFEIVGFMQEAVESPTCPHFVTGSAMSILAREIIGRGSLFGRFDSEEIKPMSGYWGAELVLKAARYYKTKIPELIAPVLANRCGGNPFYITAVVKQAAKRKESLSDEEAINEMLAVDISSGFIWGELHDQVTRWIERMNAYGITKWVLYLSALEEGDRLDVERIQRELNARDGKDVPLDTIRNVLIKLSRGDLLEYLELGGWFRKVDDPILLEFLKVWGRIEVEGHNQAKVRDELITRYKKLEKRINEYKGYLGEVFMSQVLLNGQRQTLPGRLFHKKEDIQMPRRFIYVRQRMRFGTGEGQEVDVIGAAGGDIWICQSKWVTGKPVGIGVLHELISQAEMVQKDMDPISIRLWLFAYKGLTKQARAFAKKHGILWSSLEEFNALLRHLGLRQLPELEDIEFISNKAG